MASKKCVEFFYDVASPYSWLAFEVICRYNSRWNINLKLRPFFLGGIMQGSENRPPATVPAKFKYLHKDVTRLAKYFEVPLVIPKSPGELMFIKGTLKPQRFLTALDLNCPETVEAMSRELWMRGWSRDEDISEDTSLVEAAQKVGINEETIQAASVSMKEQSVKDQLKKTTQEALDLGAFGAPMIVTELNGQKEWVFGSDRFPVFAQMIGEKWEGPNPGVSS